MKITVEISDDELKDMVMKNISDRIAQNMYHGWHEGYVYKKEIKEIKGDAIRSMTDEELATWLNCMQSNAYHCGEFGRTNAAYPFDNKAWLDWLKQEYKNE